MRNTEWLVEKHTYYAQILAKTDIANSVFLIIFLSPILFYGFLYVPSSPAFSQNISSLITPMGLIILLGLFCSGLYLLIAMSSLTVRPYVQTAIRMLIRPLGTLALLVTIVCQNRELKGFVFLQK